MKLKPDFADNAQCVSPYPERVIDMPTGKIEVTVSQPSRLMVVMGASGKPAEQVFGDQLEAFNVPLFRRKGGGGTVLLGPGTIVVTVHAGVSHTFRNREYFAAINRALVWVFKQWSSHRFELQGISDIAADGRKIVGCSLYRRKHLLLYQGSILVDVDMTLMERLLTIPERQPDYRQNRSHREFMNSLRGLGIDLPMQHLITDLKSRLPQRIFRELSAFDAAFGLPAA